MSKRGWTLVGGLAAVVVVAISGWVWTSTPDDQADQDLGQCRLDDYRTVVDCSLEHHWEPVGSADLSLNLAPSAVYPYDALWFVLYGGECTRLAMNALNPEQVLAGGLAVVGTPVSMPTPEEWNAGHRVVTCGAGVELASEANASPRMAQVNPISGKGSLQSGTWVAGDA